MTSSYHKCDQNSGIKKVPLFNGPYISSTALREVAFYEHCKHKNIATYYGHTIVSNDNHIEIHIQLKDYPHSLFDFIATENSNRNREYSFRKIFSGVTRALMYLHKQEILHGDIKPENIALNDDYESVFIDFGGISVRDKDGKYGKSVTTFEYASPEYSDAIYYGKCNDIWALGMTMLFYFVGDYVATFDSLEEVSAYYKRNSGRLPSHVFRRVPYRYRKLILKMLDPEYQERMTIGEVARVLRVTDVDTIAKSGIKDCRSERSVFIESSDQTVLQTLVPLLIDPWGRPPRFDTVEDRAAVVSILTTIKCRMFFMLDRYDE